jgi:hypothetical protein
MPAKFWLCVSAFISALLVISLLKETLKKSCLARASAFADSLVAGSGHPMAERKQSFSDSGNHFVAGSSPREERRRTFAEFSGLEVQWREQARLGVMQVSLLFTPADRTISHFIFIVTLSLRKRIFDEEVRVRSITASIHQQDKFINHQKPVFFCTKMMVGPVSPLHRSRYSKINRPQNIYVLSEKTMETCRSCCLL